MSGFVTAEQGRVHVHALTADRFKTVHLNLKLMRELTRKEATSTALLPYLWLEGTASLPSARALMQRADELYGAGVRSAISKRADRHIAEVSHSVVDERCVAEPGLGQAARSLTLDLITHPYLEAGGFPEKHVQREIVQHRRRIESLFDDKIAFAMDRCLDLVYLDTPFQVHRLGYVEDLDEITGASLYAAHQQLLRGAQVHVYLIGPIGPAEAAAASLCEWLERRLPATDASGEEATDASIRPLSHRSGDVHRVVEEQKINQGKLNLAYTTGISHRDDNFPAMMVCNGIFGGFSHSKLFENVREKASLAYYASSRLDGLTGALAVQTGIEVGKREQVEQIVDQQMQAMRAGDISDDEMTFTLRGLRNQLLQASDQPGALLDLHFAGVLTGRTRQMEELLTDIALVTKPQVVAAAAQMRLDTVYFLRSEVAANA